MAIKHNVHPFANFMATYSGLTCSTAVPAAIKRNALGFQGAGCCASPCPSEPLQHVVICFEVNDVTTVTIEVSCPTSCVEPTTQPLNGGTTDPGSTLYPRGWDGISESSWNFKKRIVKFDQWVQQGSFIRIRTCSNPGTCATTAANCGLKAGVTSGGITIYPDAPKLLKFDVNGENIMGFLEQVQGIVDPLSLHRNNCVYVGCATRSPVTGDCCQVTGPLVFDNLDEIPWGSEILVGPVGTRKWSIFPSY